jgi:hypothetical protein
MYVILMSESARARARVCVCVKRNWLGEKTKNGVRIMSELYSSALEKSYSELFGWVS